MSKLTKEKIKEVKRLRGLFPKEIKVGVERSEDGGFVAEIKTFPGCFTEAETFSELIEMANDAVITFFDVPETYASFMPSYIPPLKAAQLLNEFPVAKKSEGFSLKLKLTTAA